MDLEGRHYHTDRKARTANDRFVFSWCRRDHIHVNAKVGL
jgi:hypothetical protein